MVNIKEMKHIPYGRQSIHEEDIQAVIDVLKSDFITQGPKVNKFEESLAEKVGAKHAVCLNSGTSALYAAYYALGIGPGDEFITTPMTFAATSNAGLYLGARPVFADIEPDTGNIDVRKIEPLINSKTRMISVVHYAGHPVDLKSVKSLCEKYNLLLVEDACHAIGAKYHDDKIGANTYADLTTFSFHPVKHITMGEGGAVTCNDENLYQKIFKFRTHGITKQYLENESQGPWYYEMQDLGFNFRLTDFQGALGYSQLSRLDENIARRKAIAARYQEAFANNPWFDVPVERMNASSAWHLFPIRLKDNLIPLKRKVFEAMQEMKMGVQTHYIPVYMHPYYRRNGYQDTNCTNAEHFYHSEISIPMFHSLSKDDQEDVISRIMNVFERIS